MKIKILSIILGGFAIGATAQETYESAQIATGDLNGTARYIGMGGAMEALGADISTMSSNPAGIGLFRRSWIGASGGATIQSGQENRNTMAGVSREKGTSNADLNQVGFVYSNKFSYNSHFNMGFNYHKGRNFNQIISAMNLLDGESSSNKLSALNHYYHADLHNGSGKYAEEAMSQHDLYDWENELEPYTIKEDLPSSDYKNDYTVKNFEDYGYVGATLYNAFRKNEGYIGEYDFNFSTNFNDRVYLGLTFGIKDVHYRSDYNYGETYAAGYAGSDKYRYNDYRQVTGTGFDVKFGVIVRPSEYSPFRFGVYVHTPTWYDLTCERKSSYDPRTYSYDYRILTPWRFGVSLGHTIGKIVAIGATYEYADYTSIKNRIKTGSYTTWYTDGWRDWASTHDTYANDPEMNKNTDKSLKGVSLVKVGIEVKPSQVLAFRLGYNYESAIYNTEGHKDGTIDAYNSYGQRMSTHDFINWKATNRVTFGMGFTFDKNWTLDLSYQYAMQKGEYHPFESVSENNGQIKNIGNICDVKNNRHQINATLGYRF